MNNRMRLGVAGALAALVVLFAIMQSLNLNQSQTDLASAYKTATIQASSFADQATDAAQLLTAVAVEAAETQSAVATTAARSQAEAVTSAEQAAAATQAQALASAQAQATATLARVIALANTAQAEAVTGAQQLAADQQAAALTTAAVEATTTLGAVVDSMETAKAEAVTDAQNAAATTAAQAVASVQARSTATLGAFINAAATTEARFDATQTAVQQVLRELSAQVATIQANPTATPQPTVEIALPQTPAELCAAAVPVIDPATRTFREPAQVLKPNVDYFAILCTGAGPVYVDLHEKLTPVTVNNFVFLAQAGYYNNTTFHRVLENFMAQGGDPTGTGTGGPGYEFGDEIVPSLKFDAPGRLAMANAGPNTNGSQFFVTFGPQSYLDGAYTIFGQVVEGQRNVRSIALRDPSANPQTSGTTLDTVLIITDPTLIKLTDAPPPTRDEVVKALGSADSLITADLVSALENKKLNQTSQELVDNAPQAIRADLGAFFDTYHHRYRVSSTITNRSCDTSQIQFYAVSYTLDAFATEADAAAAIVDPVLEQLALKNGFDAQLTSERLAHPYFTATETVCDQKAIHAMTYWRHGTFITTVEIVLPADMQEAGDLLDAALLDFVGARIYEPLLVDILYSDIE